MSKKLHGLTVRGKQRTWTFDVYVDPRYIQEWRDDGIEIDEIVNTIPKRVVDLGFARAWIFLQDIFQFRNPFKS